MVEQPYLVDRYCRLEQVRERAVNTALRIRRRGITSRTGITSMPRVARVRVANP